MMTAWDYVAAVSLSIAASFLVIHAVMVGNPQYGWQPRSWVVRTLMIALAATLGARAWTVFHLHEPINPLGRWVCFVMALLFFVTWLDMVVTSWRVQTERAKATAEHDLATRMVERVGIVAAAGLAQSAENHDALEAIKKSISIFDPAPVGRSAGSAPSTTV